MVAQPRHRRVADAGISGLEPHLETVRFRQGSCLMREGSPGDACYVIVSGEVRAEVERPDFDTDGVVAFLGPGSVCGEFGLLDAGPRSASVYAHTDVVARRLSADALRELCDSDPAAGVRVLRWLSRSAAGKARAFSKDLEEFILAGEPDPAMDALVARSAAAQQSLLGWPEGKIDDLITALAAEIADHADELAAATVAETGIGCVADKADKNRFAALDVARSLVGKPGVGIIGGEAAAGPWGKEKLAPLLSLFTADGPDDGLRLCQQILGNGGRGHTAIIHTRSRRRQLSFARQMPASRILVNGPGSQGCIGLGNGLTPSLTLGCGTYGGTSTTDNVTYTNLLNIKRVARPLVTGPSAGS